MLYCPIDTVLTVACGGRTDGRTSGRAEPERLSVRVRSFVLLLLFQCCSIALCHHHKTTQQASRIASRPLFLSFRHPLHSVAVAVAVAVAVVLFVEVSLFVLLPLTYDVYCCCCCCCRVHRQYIHTRDIYLLFLGIHIRGVFHLLFLSFSFHSFIHSSNRSLLTN